MVVQDVNKNTAPQHGESVDSHGKFEESCLLMNVSNTLCAQIRSFMWSPILLKARQRSPKPKKAKTTTDLTYCGFMVYL